MTGPRIDLDLPICPSGKRPFRDEREAHYELGRAQGRRRETSGYKRGQVEKRAYQCPACHHWHLTAKSKR